MRIIGLTGSIACGKSTVSEALKEQPDCRIIDGDQLARELTAPGGPALSPIRETFGNGVFLSDGSLNRQVLGQLVFSDFRARAQLDQLMAPFLEELTQQRIQEARDSGAVLCFLDYPLLFEKGYDRLCDTVWCVYLPRDLQLERLMARDGLTREEASARINAVLSSEEKASRSQVILDNSGAPSYTLSLLPSMLEAERQAALQPRRRRSSRHTESVNNPDPAEKSGTDPSSLAAWQKENATPSVPLRPSFAPSGIPAVMQRPEAARKKPSERKIAWRLPVWLMASLLSVTFVLLCCVTAQSMMRAYLARRAEQHQAEESAVFRNYPLDYHEMIEKYAAEYNLKPAFVAAIIRHESSFQPREESRVGARGLMQLMPDTAEWIAHKLKVSGYHFDRMWDPESNVRFGCWYLNYLSSLFRGDPVCVACAYHAGQGTVTAWLSDPLISDDGVTLQLARLPDGPTKSYAGRITKAYGIYQVLYFENSGILPDSGAADSV